MREVVNGMSKSRSRPYGYADFVKLTIKSIRLFPSENLYGGAGMESIQDIPT